MKTLYRFAKSGNRSNIDSLIDLRRKTNQELERQEQQKKDLEIFWHSPQTDILISLCLYMKHDCEISQKAFSIMNYYKISFDKVDNSLFLRNLEQSQVVTTKDWTYPLLRVNVSVDPTQFISGTDLIIQFLINKELIQNVYQISAWSEQGLGFIQEKIKKPLDLLFLNPILTWQNKFKSSPDAYRKDAKNYQIISQMLQLGFSSFYLSSLNLIQLIQRKDEYLQSQKLLLEGMNEWVQRLGGQDYHGGSSPDDADFTLFGVIMSRYQSFSFRQFLEKKAPLKFESWVIRMRQKCQYETERFYADSEDNQIQ